MTILDGKQIIKRLEASGIYESKGAITMSLNGIDVRIKGTDSVGNNIQEWFGQWMVNNDIYFRTPDNTQNFPDFFLSHSQDTGLLEVKSFFSKRRPAFDVANFDSYWQSLRESPYRLDADYLIFAYDLDDGDLSIRNIFLKKVWQITGPAKEFPLNCQRKNGQIYNIRPVSFHSPNAHLPAFASKEAFIASLYQTVLGHTNKASKTREWLNDVLKGYREYSGMDLSKEVYRYI